MIYLVHHADAVPGHVDSTRPLSARGRAAAHLLAVRAADREAYPECIWHSGKLRARQTAELFWRTCNALATLTAERGLQPEDPPAWMRDRLIGETRDVMLVGHMPHLAGLLRLMLGAEPQTGGIFPLHGVVALDATGDGWVERWRISTDDERGL